MSQSETTKLPKILLARTDAGSGHRSASSALKTVLDQKYAGKYEVVEMDIFKVADMQPFNTVDSIHELISQNYTVEQINNGLIRVFNTSLGFAGWNAYLLYWMYDECKRIIELEKPDMIVSLHPLVTMIVRAIKEKGGKFKSVVVIQDLISIFRGWADPSADLTFSPTGEGVSTLVRYGVSVEKIAYPLFPVKPSMANFRSREEVLSELDLDPKKTTVLVSGGGVGTKAMMKGIDKLIKRNKDVQIVILTGHLTGFKQRLERLYQDRPNVKAVGFIPMQDYINAADIVVTKPGPANLIEVELFNKKAIVTRKVGWQEYGNIDYALRNPKFRYIGDEWNQLADAVDDLLEAKVQEPHNGHRRTFDEAELIVKEMLKLLEL